MVAFAGYPLLIEDRLVGVMGTFARHPLPSVTLEIMGSLANVIALAVDHQRAEMPWRNGKPISRDSLRVWKTSGKKNVLRWPVKSMMN